MLIVSGWLIDLTNSVQASFLVSGSAAVFAGILCGFIPTLPVPDAQQPMRQPEQGSAVVAFSLAGGGILVGPYLTGARPRSRRRKRSYGTQASLIRSVINRHKPKPFSLRMYSRSPGCSRVGDDDDIGGRNVEDTCGSDTERDINKTEQGLRNSQRTNDAKRADDKNGASGVDADEIVYV